MFSHFHRSQTLRARPRGDGQRQRRDDLDFVVMYKRVQKRYRMGVFARIDSMRTRSPVSPCVAGLAAKRADPGGV
jgi:hypothetical protein